MPNKKTRELLLILFSLFVTLLSFEYFKSKIDSDVEQIAGGFQEATALSQKQFMCRPSEIECVKGISESFRINKSTETLLMLGNSQMGAINQMKNGDMTYAQIIAEQLNSQGNNARSIWMPNASLIEFKMLYETISRCGSYPQYLVIPVFLDDTRESSVRQDISQLEYDLCPNSKHKAKESSSLKEIDIPITIENRSSKLSNLITKRLPIISELPTLNAHFRGNLYLLRNTIFGINASSKRKILPSSYKKNLSSLEKIIENRRQLGMKTLIYIPPLLYSKTRPSMIPYKIYEYKSFKEEVNNLCQNSSCKFVNLEDVVPDSEWGTKASTSLSSNKEELDFMHFTGKGHISLANVLIHEFIYFKP